MKKYLSILIIFIVALLAAPGMAEDLTIFDKDGKVQGYVRDGVVYDKNWSWQFRIDKDGRILDRNQITQGYIREDRVYGSDWQPKGYIRKESEPSTKGEKK